MTIYNYYWFEIVQYNFIFHLKTNTNHSSVRPPRPHFINIVVIYIGILLVIGVYIHCILWKNW